MHYPKKINGDFYVFGTQYSNDEKMRVSGQSYVTSNIDYRENITLFKLVPIKTFNKEEYLNAIGTNFKGIV